VKEITLIEEELPYALFEPAKCKMIPQFKHHAMKAYGRVEIHLSFFPLVTG
jgi:hypothetical protein